MLFKIDYFEYDKFSTLEGGGGLGEGWVGSYRIYDNKGSYITVSFDCYCQPGYNREHLKISFRRHKESEKFIIVWADARADSVFNYENIIRFRSYLDWDSVSLLNLFCFLVYSMGKLFQFYQNNRFEILSSEDFNNFWSKMEKSDTSNSKTEPSQE